METIFSTIDHVISLENDKTLRVWETLPKENTLKKNNTILIASGFARRMDHFAGLAEYLSSNGFHVIRYDSLHHVGLSSGNINEFSMTIGKDSLLTVIDWLKGRNIENLGLIAASLSARIAYEIANEIDLSFLVTAVGVVNLRDTLERALKYDYLQLPIEQLPEDLDFEGHNLGSEVFVTDCFKHQWDTLDSTINKMKDLDIPFIAFTANDDNWVKQSEVLDLLTSLNSEKCKLYSLIGSSHDLGENLVVLRNFYQSVTKAAIALDHGSLDLDVNMTEPRFEDITSVTVKERRLKNQIENESLEFA
ncbi:MULTISPECIES: acyl transferase [Aliivibrio]|uniref:Acyl transferase n=1 Tax=Aliivibrio logei 5S-186 TaxID=626086 RepID=A0ABX3AVK8_ALILO|nr:MULTISPECIES: acyl transferase [Aliivibrio]MBB1315667.1 acyl transferase [Aliivibrio sp. SR45-2]OEF11932.1 acyl transferase [Aliivibrio logei 5S-186]